MRTVQDLINDLQAIKDKGLPVIIESVDEDTHNVGRAVLHTVKYDERKYGVLCSLKLGTPYVRLWIDK